MTQEFHIISVPWEQTLDLPGHTAASHRPSPFIGTMTLANASVNSPQGLLLIIPNVAVQIPVGSSLCADRFNGYRTAHFENLPLTSHVARDQLRRVLFLKCLL